MDRTSVATGGAEGGGGAAVTGVGRAGAAAADGCLDAVVHGSAVRNTAAISRALWKRSIGRSSKARIKACSTCGLMRGSKTRTGVKACGFTMRVVAVGGVLPDSA